MVGWAAALISVGTSERRVASAGARSRHTVEPMRTSSPARSVRRSVIWSPFTYVPFVEPRSSIDSSPAMIWIAACRRDTSGSLRVMSQSSRPIVVPGSSGRSVPCAGSCSMNTKSVIAAPRSAPA